MEDQGDSPSLKHKLKSSLCLSCCFRNHENFSSNEKPKLIQASSVWLKARSNEFPEIKDKCRNLISRIGRGGRRHSADFRYDALSYSLNFDEGSNESHGDQRPLRNFSSRLPASPPPENGVAVKEVVASREITACS
ncbi:hypothetical protein L1049_000597 [Liquidambar formosana]|uniref:Uncharacterized protein n=1 Tax=Liquidambar formosana TaxID=63359 RepID=A0AAP0N928_LIQFO